MALIICDTSGLLAIAECLGDERKEKRLYSRLEEVFGKGFTLLFHPISVVELATNSHQEIHFRKFGDINWKSKASQLANRNLNALIVLGFLENDFGVKLTEIPKPRKCPIDEGYWLHLTTDRISYTSLTCQNGEPRHKLAMADYQIFSLATYLKKVRANIQIGIFTGDNEIITASLENKIPFVGVYPHSSLRSWKNCEEDASCFNGEIGTVGGGCLERFCGPSSHSLA